MLIPINILVVFFSISILLALSPGPDNIFVLSQSALRGRIAGWVITLGLCTGLIGHTLLVASGVAVIFKVSFMAFATLKLAGIAYLLYLSYLAFQESTKKLKPAENGGASLYQLYRRGIIMNVTNPKVSIFFLSFLPQFADPKREYLMLQIGILGFIFICSALIVFGLISFFAGYLCGYFQRSSRAQNIINCISGIVYIAMAIKLITVKM